MRKDEADKVLLNKKEAAYMLGKSERQMSEYQKDKLDPLPIFTVGGRGRTNEYDAQELLAWAIRHKMRQIGVHDSGKPKTDYEYERGRLAKLQADGQQMRNEIISREVVPIKLLEFSLGNVTEQIVSHLETIPMKIKKALPQLRGTEIDIIKRIITKAQNAASTAELDYDRLEELIKEIGK